MKNHPTHAESERQRTREATSGRYAKGLTCEACGGTAPFNYYSHPDCNSGGRLLVLCGRKRCPGTYASAHIEKMDEALAYIASILGDK